MRISDAALLAIALVVSTPASVAADLRGTTSGDIALGNLDAQIEGIERAEDRAGRTPAGTVRLISLLETRGHFRGRISDYERAAALAADLVRERPAEARTHMALARTAALFHRFGAARAHLAAARRLGGDAELERLQAAVEQGAGDFAAALQHRAGSAASRSPVELGLRAVVLAECGDLERARTDFAAARRVWRASRDVSPLTPAWLAFEEGLAAMRAGELEEARRRLGEAHRLLPGYVPAEGHLAEVEAELGDAESAIRRLAAIAPTSDDPDYAHQLARLLEEQGRGREARRWRARAAERFQELAARHPEAFADHAAEFWLGIGGDVARALELARLNAAERRMPRAIELWGRAALALGDEASAAEADAALQALQQASPCGRARRLRVAAHGGAQAAR